MVKASLYWSSNDQVSRNYASGQNWPRLYSSPPISQQTETFQSIKLYWWADPYSSHWHLPYLKHRMPQEQHNHFLTSPAPRQWPCCGAAQVKEQHSKQHTCLMEASLRYILHVSGTVSALGSQQITGLKPQHPSRIPDGCTAAHQQNQAHHLLPAALSRLFWHTMLHHKAIDAW